MDQRISFFSFAVRDLDASRRFYCDGLGWVADLDVPGEVVMIQAGERLVLSLWDETAFQAEVGPISRGPGVAPFTVAHNVATREEVDAVLETARAARATRSASPPGWVARSERLPRPHQQRGLRAALGPGPDRLGQHGHRSPVPRVAAGGIGEQVGVRHRPVVLGRCDAVERGVTGGHPGTAAAATDERGSTTCRDRRPAS